MCRLFASVHSGPARSPLDALGAWVVDDFRRLGEVHRDGWGAVWTASDSLFSYHSTQPASRDGLYGAVVTQPVGSLILHERLASPGIALSLDNQQPFTSGGLAFAHNGTLTNANGNIVNKPASYRRALGLAHSTTGSDSRIYAEVFFHHLASLVSVGTPPTVAQVHRALGQTVGILRRDYPEASFNNLIETPEFTVVTRAHADRPQLSETLRHLYTEAGWAHHLDNYFEIGHTTVDHPDGGRTSAVSSSGYSAWETWTPVANNSMVVLSHRDASVEVVPLG